MYDFAEQMSFDEKALGNKSFRNTSPIRLLKPPAIKASGISTLFLPGSPNDLCDRLKLLLYGKEAVSFLT